MNQQLELLVSDKELLSYFFCMLTPLSSNLDIQGFMCMCLASGKPCLFSQYSCKYYYPFESILIM